MTNESQEPTEKIFEKRTADLVEQTTQGSAASTSPTRLHRHPRNEQASRAIFATLLQSEQAPFSD